MILSCLESTLSPSLLKLGDEQLGAHQTLFCLFENFHNKKVFFFKGTISVRLLKHSEVRIVQEIALGSLGIPGLGQEAQGSQCCSSTTLGRGAV